MRIILKIRNVSMKIYIRYKNKNEYEDKPKNKDDEYKNNIYIRII